jgi:hypothetical protein
LAGKLFNLELVFEFNYSTMSNPFFNNNRQAGRRYSYGPVKHHGHMRSSKAMNFTENFSEFPVGFLVSQLQVRRLRLNLSSSSCFFNFIRQQALHNSTMNSSRSNSYLSRSFSNASNSSGSSSMFRQSHEKPSFSSLFTANGSKSFNDPFSCDVSPPGNDDDGVYLQISNLDQWYDEQNLRNYLMTQLKPITPILSLNIETPSIAKVSAGNLMT